MTRADKTSLLLLVIVFVSGALFFFRLGERSLRNPDEGRYAEIAKEMVLSGNWLEPKIYAVDYLKKPPLFYWLIAVSLNVFGSNEWAARSVPAIFGIAGILITFWFARKVFDEETAFFSCLILASNFWYLQVSRYLVIDAVFSFFVVSGLYFFFTAVHAQQNKKIFYLLFYSCASFSFLAKGVLGMILSAIAAGIFLLKKKRVIKTLSEMSLGWGLVLFFLIVPPWFIMISLKNPDFLNLFFLHENFSRFASGNFEHQQAWYFYLALLPAVLMPWTVFVRPIKEALVFSGNSHSRNDEKFFLLAASLGFVIFFSLSKSKLLTYILPSIPFFAIFIGKAWHDWLAGPLPEKDDHRWAEGLPLFFLVLLGSAMVLATPAVILRLGPDIPEDIGIYFQWMGAVILACAVAGLKAWKRQNRRHLFYILIGLMAALSVPFAFAIEAFNADYTNKHFAADLKARVRPSDWVFIYDHPGALYDFGFYLDHPVTLVGLEGELEFSRKGADNLNAVVTHNQFRKMMEDREKLYCLARKSDFFSLDPETRKNLTILKEDRRKVLFST